MIKDLLDSEEGQGLAEYALIFALLVLAVIIALSSLGTRIAFYLNQTAQKWS